MTVCQAAITEITSMGPEVLRVVLRHHDDSFVFLAVDDGFDIVELHINVGASVGGDDLIIMVKKAKILRTDVVTTLNLDFH